MRLVKLKLLLAVLTISLLSGCTLLDNVNQSLNYVDEATKFINEGTQLAEHLPVLAERSITDPQARTDLKNQLTEMKAKIEAFNKLEPPGFAKNVHQQLLGYNEILMKEINAYLEQLNLGQVDWKAITNSKLVQTLDQLTQVLDKVQNLAP